MSSLDKFFQQFWHATDCVKGIMAAGLAPVFDTLYPPNTPAPSVSDDDERIKDWENWAATQFNTEPQLNADELVAVRRLIEERRLGLDTIYTGPLEDTNFTNFAGAAASLADDDSGRTSPSVREDKQQETASIPDPVDPQPNSHERLLDDMGACEALIGFVTEEREARLAGPQPDSPSEDVDSPGGGAAEDDTAGDPSAAQRPTITAHYFLGDDDKPCVAGVGGGKSCGKPLSAHKYYLTARPWSGGPW